MSYGGLNSSIRVVTIAAIWHQLSHNCVDLQAGQWCVSPVPSQKPRNDHSMTEPDPPPLGPQDEDMADVLRLCLIPGVGPTDPQEAPGAVRLGSGGAGGHGRSAAGSAGRRSES